MFGIYSLELVVNSLRIHFKFWVLLGLKMWFMGFTRVFWFFGLHMTSRFTHWFLNLDGAKSSALQSMDFGDAPSHKPKENATQNGLNPTLWKQGTKWLEPNSLSGVG